MLTIYEKQNDIGEAWFKTAGGKKYYMIDVLSAFYEKYFFISQDFSTQFKDNSFKKLDIIEDTLLIETENGFFVEKYEILNGVPFPLNYQNNFISLSGLNEITYWYDEIDRELKTFQVQVSSYGQDINNIHLTFKIYNIDLGEYTRKNAFSFSLSGEVITAIDCFKSCYNTDTNTYNITFLFNDENLYTSNLKFTKNWDIDSVFFITPRNNFVFLNDFQKFE
jgi:hypothetical protein